MKWFVTLVLGCSQAFAQQLPPADPAVELGICEQQSTRFLSDSRKAQAYMTQFLAEIADLKKRLAEAEAKLPK